MREYKHIQARNREQRQERKVGRDRNASDVNAAWEYVNILHAMNGYEGRKEQFQFPNPGRGIVKFIEQTVYEPVTES